METSNNIHPISKWLDKKIDNYPPKYNLNHRDLNTYYLVNDKNLLCNKQDKISELENLNKEINECDNFDNLIEKKSDDELISDKCLIEDSNYIHIFRNNNERFVQYLDPNTPRYHVNMIFNRILDYCYKNNLYDIKGELFFDKRMRNDFVKFCYEN